MAGLLINHGSYMEMISYVFLRLGFSMPDIDDENCN